MAPLDASFRPPQWYAGPSPARPEALIDQHHRVLADPQGNIIGRPGPLNDGQRVAKTLHLKRADTRDF